MIALRDVLPDLRTSHPDIRVGDHPNIYDDPSFFEGYSRLPRSLDGLDGAAEWPVLRDMLPDMRGLRVVDLGCGWGGFCRWARENGAAHVHGIDLSSRMLAHACSNTLDPTIVYELGSLEHLTLPPESFDLAYSSLAFHYISDAARLYAQIARSLRPGGHLVFSTEHPVYMAAAKPGWVTSETGEKVWPVDSYFAEGPRRTDWITKGVLKYHRTIGTTLNLLIRSGFKIAQVEEFCPTAAQITARPALAEELQRPTFLLVSALRE